MSISINSLKPSVYSDKIDVYVKVYDLDTPNVWMYLFLREDISENSWATNNRNIAVNTHNTETFKIDHTDIMMYYSLSEVKNSQVRFKLVVRDKVDSKIIYAKQTTDVRNLPIKAPIFPEFGNYTDLGNKYQGKYLFNGRYYCYKGEQVHLKYYVDGNIMESTTKTSTGLDLFYYHMNESYFDKLSYGKHTVRIDLDYTYLGGSKTVSHSATFNKIIPPNKIPTISDKDNDLGEKNSGFTIDYKINDENLDQSLTVTEKLNNTILKTLNNAPRNQDLTIEFTDEQVRALPLNEKNTIQIKVDDGNGGIAYRNYYFTRTNSAPIISLNDENLGDIIEIPSKIYSLCDIEGNEINIVEKINDTVLNTFKADENKDYTLTIDEDTWIALENNKVHNLIIEATDSLGSISTKKLEFKKVINSIILEKKEPVKTDALLTKVLFVPVITNNIYADISIKVCNNAFDDNPTWEDITDCVKNNSVYKFKNTTKTSDTWGWNYKIEITRKENTNEKISLEGFGGSFE